MSKQLLSSPVLRKWAVTAVGLGSIPFIIEPIDRCVHVTRSAFLLFLFMYWQIGRSLYGPVQPAIPEKILFMNAQSQIHNHFSCPLMFCI